ncbi:MAG TPA: hypothetical protein PK156_04695 [Polyangium sp.]|nr:hypothetical protein [Polyangium sp.]
MQPPRPSHVTFEPPDLAIWHLIGHVEESDIVRIYDAQLAFAKDKPYLLTLIDVSRFESITPAGRRAAAQGPTPGHKVMPVRGSVVIGASFHIQVLGLLVAKAAKMIHRQDDMDLQFCDTEAQARSWLEKKRREIATKS